MRRRQLAPRFVDIVPERPDEGSLYISIEFGLAVHLCACGCGQKVVTPFSPAEWRLIYDGETVSLAPSVGNWSFDCQSHYWITGSRVKWAAAFSPERIARVRQRDASALHAYYDPPEGFGEQPEPPVAKPGWWRRLLTRLRSLRQ